MEFFEQLDTFYDELRDNFAPPGLYGVEDRLNAVATAMATGELEPINIQEYAQLVAALGRCLFYETPRELVGRVRSGARPLAGLEAFVAAKGESLTKEIYMLYSGYESKVEGLQDVLLGALFRHAEDGWEEGRILLHDSEVNEMLTIYSHASYARMQLHALWLGTQELGLPCSEVFAGLLEDNFQADREFSAEFAEALDCFGLELTEVFERYLFTNEEAEEIGRRVYTNGQLREPVWWFAGWRAGEFGFRQQDTTLN